MQVLFQRFTEKYARTQVKTTRLFEQEIDWNNQLIGLKGARGVGKTTLLLQHIKKNYALDNSVLYTSLDHLYFLDNKLYDFATDFHQKGGKLLVLDEVHRYPNWSIELKNIYDDFPDLKVIFTGSSLLEINRGKADLSRRAVMYNMCGLSLREFINFETGEKFEPIAFEQVLTNHRQIAANIIAKIKPLSHMANYLQYGYYPFYLENKNTYHTKLEQALHLVLDVDIPQYEQVQISNIVAIKRLLQIIASSVPFKPNYTAISQRSGISINTLKNYINYLSDAELILLLYPNTNGLGNLGKPEKIYLHNSSLVYNMVGNNADIGNIRETFFFNQVSPKAMLNASPHADFLVNGKYTFEVGGKNKKKKQIADVDNSFIVMDDIETGYDNVIPLWLFGFLY
ncbi:MAG TPA: AAA family ATPase [Prolixibacteraceae bacterium]|nr:AAA family ATPase [Prolixibacteraceae bacterium]